ncbi:MAG: zinc transporter ZupT [Deltaproteobacteria bacterium]|nr:zinc transporter ZupT [Deltaproteobacteria bacterium]
MEADRVIMALGLTLLAGLSTGIGSAMAFFARRTSTRFLSISLGFSAGVMIYVSFVELLAEARHALQQTHGRIGGDYLTAGAFFGGLLVAALIDRLIPAHENPHEVRSVEQMCAEEQGGEAGERRLMRTGMLAAVAIAVHNFPEGIASFAAALSSPALGVSIAVAIAIHNIPEGIAVSVPIYYATGSRKKAFWYSFLSGLSEPVGALLGYALLAVVFSDAVMGSLLAGVAGVMVFISLDELFPAAREYGEPHLAIYGLIVGMAVMALSLLLVG